VKVGIEKLGLVKDDAHNRDKWRSLTTGNRPTLPQSGKSFMDCILITLNASSSSSISIVCNESKKNASRSKS